MVDHLRNGLAARLTHCQTFVLDEADRLLEQGFADSIDVIIGSLEQNRAIAAPRQTLLFSATMSNEIKKVCLDFHDSLTPAYILLQGCASRTSSRARVHLNSQR